MNDNASELHNAFEAALARSPRDASRYAEVGKKLASWLGVPPTDVAVKTVASVSADLRNRVGEVTQRRQPRCIAIALDPDPAAIRSEAERAEAEIVGAYSEGRLGSTVILVAKDNPGNRWSINRILEPGQISASTRSLISRLNLPESVVKVSQLSPARADQESQNRIWLEFTKSEHNHGGAGWEFGTCLWSPTTDRDGKDRYAVMRMPKPGDRVIHALDSTIVGSSVASHAAVKTANRPPNAGAWGWAESYYRIELSDYRPFTEPLTVSSLISRRFHEIIGDIRGNTLSHYPFCEHSGSIRIVQGAYLTAVPPSLLAILKNELGSSGSTDVDIESVESHELRTVPEEELVIDPRELDLILQLWYSRKNIILQGPPGVGKTVLAHQLARTVVDGDGTRICSVQFHQSYSYEDFVLGWRPGKDGDFALEDGVFKHFCAQAAKRPSAKHVFVIDEINRGNVARIFGELLTLIERDKRTQRHALPLLYGEQPRPPFFVPPNVFIIGMMNTADRSLAVVDYALRRRFAFYMLEPLYGDPRYTRLLVERGVETELAKQIDEKFRELNREIVEDRKNLGPGFAIGHSYFIPRNGAAPDREWYMEVVRREIGPLLREYWFDRPEHAEGVISKLLT